MNTQNGHIVFPLNTIHVSLNILQAYKLKRVTTEPYKVYVLMSHHKCFQYATICTPDCSCIKYQDLLSFGLNAQVPEKQNISESAKIITVPDNLPLPPAPSAPSPV